MEFPKINKNSRFYKNCVQRRKNGAKICQDCPFRNGIEDQEWSRYTVLQRYNQKIKELERELKERGE